jgi:hypothetical protein
MSGMLIIGDINNIAGICMPGKSHQHSGRIPGISTVLSQLQPKKGGYLTINFDESFISAVINGDIFKDGPQRCEFL